MHTFRALLLLAGVTAISGCSAAVQWTRYGFSDKGPDQTQAALLQEQSAPYRQRGDSTVTGRAYLVAPDGHRIPGADGEVYLTPVTTWGESRVVDVLTTNKIPKGEARGAEVWWVTRADNGGRFAFEDLVGGEYFVLCPISYAAGGEADEVVAFAKVKIGPAERGDFEVTRQLDK